VPIYLTRNRFLGGDRVAADLHPNPYFSKVPSFAAQGLHQVGRSLSHGCGDGAAGGGKFEHAIPRTGDVHPLGEGTRQLAADERSQRSFFAATRRPGGDARIGVEDPRKRGQA